MTDAGSDGADAPEGEAVPDGEDADPHDSGSSVAPGEDRPDWTVEVTAEGAPAVGDAVRFTKTLSAADVERFALAAGDTNPIHLDEAAAAETPFEGRVVHGALTAGLVSAALARFPGTVVYLSQDLAFRAPVRVGDRPTAEATVVEALGGDRYRLETTVDRGDTRVVDGEAVVRIDLPP